jgi:DNA-binding MarR family transcriptional regulator
MARQLERSSGDLNLAHYRVLAAVADGDERASRVADRLALGKPTVSAAVESLTKRGLLSREDAAEDRRAATLSLTPAGEAALAEVEGEMVTRLDEFFDRTPDPDAVLAALAQLGVALDEVADERLAARKAKRAAGKGACAATRRPPRRRPARSTRAPPAGCGACSATYFGTVAMSRSPSGLPSSALPARPGRRCSSARSSTG